MSRAGALAILERIVVLLARHGYRDKADWLSERAEVLRDPASTPEQTRLALDDVHRIVPGMGGLIDLPLDDAPGFDTAAAKTELDGLADAIFDLTR